VHGAAHRLRTASALKEIAPMFRRRQFLALLAGTIVLGTAACGGDDSTDSTTPVTVGATAEPAATDTTITAPPTTTHAPTTTEASTTTTVAIVEPGPLQVTTRDYAFEGMPEVIRAGTYTITVTNEGAEHHEFVILRPTTGKTLEELEALGPEGIGEHAELGAFVPPFAGGTTSSPVEFTLSPGEWTVVCFIPALHDGQPHFHHGMTQTLTVVA
jgi:hypothetical protein